MRYTENEAKAIIEQFNECSLTDLGAMFNRESTPMFEEFEGETKGAFLSWNPKNSWWLMCLIRICFNSPFARWIGKQFITSFNEEKKGHGVNLFKNKFIPLRFKFDTNIQNAHVDSNSCLVLDYRSYPSLMFGLVDDVRKIQEGVLLGQMYYKFPLRKELWFVGYFVLCALKKR